MAEIKNPGRLNGMTCFFSDLSGNLYPTTGTIDCIVKDSFLHSLVNPQTHSVIITQQGGVLAPYAVIKEYQGPSEFTVTMLFRDPGNTTDMTLYGLIKQLHESESFSNAFSTWGSTNPTPGGGNILAVDMTVTHIRMQGASSNVSFTASVGVKAVSGLKAVEKGLGFDVTFYTLEPWVIS